jgi:hypothetical protein
VASMLRSRTIADPGSRNQMTRGHLRGFTCAR